MTTDFRAELERLVDLYEALGGNWSPHGYTDTWNDALASARAALATSPPEAPTIGSVEDAAKAIYSDAMTWAAANVPSGAIPPWVEGGNSTAQDVARRVARSLATPPPEAPTDEERLADFTKWLAREMPPNTIIGDPLWWAPRIWRAVHKRWGHG